MTGAVPTVAALSAHARHVSAVERSAFAASLRGGRLDGRILVLETCHRVDAFAAGEAASDLRAVPRPAASHLYHDDDAIRHAVAVAVGRDSVVVGEDQILHQLRAAVGAARAARMLDPHLERLFSSALRAGRRARSWRQGPGPSLATVALATIQRRSAGATLRDRRLLVVGAGRMGSVVAREAVAAGIEVTVASRTVDAAAALAATVDARIAPFDPGPAIAAFDAVVIALAGPWDIADATAGALVDAGSTLVDLSVPLAIPPDLATRAGDRLVTADDLARDGIPDRDADPRLAARLDALIDATTDEIGAWLAGEGGRSAAARLTDRADRARADELDALWRRLPELDPEARAAIDAMTRHLATRLLREPLERLGHDPDGRAERAVREVFAL